MCVTWGRFRMRIDMKIQIRIGIVLMHTACMYIVIKLSAIEASIYVLKIYTINICTKNNSIRKTTKLRTKVVNTLIKKKFLIYSEIQRDRVQSHI
jgi:hypothetical protein